jgi:DNA-binding beta-propeller fold protein YncE
LSIAIAMMVGLLASSPSEDRSTPTASALTLLLAAIAVTLGLLVAAPGALAANKYQQVEKFARGFSFLTAESVAVNDHNGKIYVADSGQGEILIFSSASDNSPTAWNGSNTPAGSFGGDDHVSVAIDNSSGDVYVADRSHAVIDKFDQDGNLITSFGDTTPSPNGQLAGAATPAGSFSPPSNFYTSFGIAVDQATHDLYVIDAGHHVIDIFDQTGAYLRQITATPTGLYRNGGEYTLGIAVNATNHNVYVTDWAGPNLLFQFDSLGNYVSTWNGGTLPNGLASQTPDGDFSGTCTGCYLISVATEDASGKVFVGSMAHEAMDVFDASGNFLPPQTVGVPSPRGIALDQSSGRVYASSFGNIVVLEPVTVPDITLNAVSGLTATSATLNGHVDPAGGGNITGCHFEYIDKTNYDQNIGEHSGFLGAQSAPCTTNPASSLPYASPTDVSATLTDLRPGTAYRYRLVASNANGGNSSSTQLFSTVGAYRFATNIGSAGDGDGQLESPRDVAIDNPSGDVYVADTGNHRIVKFDSSGNFLATWGWGVSDGSTASQVCTSGCQAGIPGSGPGQFTTPRYIEVDNSAGPSAGDVYIADTADDLVQKFDPSGDLISTWGSAGAIDFGGSGGIGGITLDPSGGLSVLTNASPNYWTEVGQDGVFRRKIAIGGAIGLGPSNGGGIDTYSSGVFYETTNGGVLLSVSTETNYEASRFDFSNSNVTVSTGLVLDRSTNDLYIDHGDYINQFATASGCPISIFGPVACPPSDFFGSGHLNSATGLAFQPSTATLYAANTGDNNIVAFTPLPVPEVTSGSVTDSAPTAATLTGHVDPAGSGDITDCHFDYGTDTTYGLGSVSCVPAPPLSGATDVSADLSGLLPFTTYHYRLVATGANDLGLFGYGHDHSFTPVQGTAPEVSAASSASVTPTGAILSAQINPKLAPTAYRFQYGIDTAYGSQTLPSESIGEDGVDHSVSNEISGLRPGTTYHFRVLATNFNGVTDGPDRTFDTPDLPAVAGTSASEITRTTANLGAQVTPGFSSTTYHFEYGTTTAYGAGPPESSPIGSDNTIHPAASAISGLTPSTTYHFRIVATNAIGAVAGPDQVFTTAPAEPPTVTQPKKCKRGFVKRHRKCVKKKRHKRRHPKRSHGHG